MAFLLDLEPRGDKKHDLWRIHYFVRRKRLFLRFLYFLNQTLPNFIFQLHLLFNRCRGGTWKHQASFLDDSLLLLHL